MFYTHVNSAFVLFAAKWFVQSQSPKNYGRNMVWEDLPLHPEWGLDVFLFSSHCYKHSYFHTLKKILPSVFFSVLSSENILISSAVKHGEMYIIMCSM